MNVLVFLLLLSFLVMTVAQSTKKKKKPKQTTTNPSSLSNRLLSMCSSTNPIRTKKEKVILAWILDATGEGSLLLDSSPQHYAACWILYKDRMAKKRNSKPKVLQRYALATLHYATTRQNTTAWDWHMANDVPSAESKKGYWMSVNRHECSWYGVTCHRRNKLVHQLSLGFLALDGLLPRELSLLTSLQELDVHGCDLQGVLPHKLLANLGKLQYLRLHMNGFFGALHREIQGLTSLKELVAFGNYIGMIMIRCYVLSLQCCYSQIVTNVLALSFLFVFFSRNGTNRLV